jgi:hypothetical protein
VAIFEKKKKQRTLGVNCRDVSMEVLEEYMQLGVAILSHIQGVYKGSTEYTKFHSHRSGIFLLHWY